MRWARLKFNKEAELLGKGEFCTGYEFLGTERLGACVVKNDDSAIGVSPRGISSVKTGVGGHSTSADRTSVDRDAMENDSENTLDLIER